MNPDVIQFQCSACQHVLTVPSHLAGVSGPCPMCGTTVTSPSAPPVPSFGMNPLAAPAPIQQPPQMHSSPPVATPHGAVMPLPNIDLHTTGVLGGGLAPAGTIPLQQPLSEPAWQQPESAAQPTITEQPPMGGQTKLEASAPPPLSMMGGFLPPSRPEGQMPMTGGVTSNGTQQVLNPDGANGQRQGAVPGHSTLIPGAPPLMVNTPANDGFGGGLLARALPSVPLQPTSLTAPLEAHAADADQARPPSAGFVPSHVNPSRSRPLTKPKRSSNVFMIGLALLLLAGALCIVGWFFRHPIQQMVAKFTSSTDVVEETAPSLPIQTEAAPVEETTPKAKPADSDSPKIDQPSKAELVADADIPKAMAEKEQEMPVKPVMEEAAKPAESTLVEVPSPEGDKPEKPNAASANVAKTGTLETKPVKVAVSPEAESAAEALKKFLSATNMAERLNYTLAADAMKPIMERYYSVNADGPILIDAIGLVTYHPKPQIGGGAHAIFGVESKTWEFPVPVMLEDVGGSFKVDWLSFVEFKDRLLEKFLLNFQEGTARFHVGITRTHYFEDKVPNSAGKEAFRISPAPPNPFMATVFVDKDSSIDRDLRDKIPWGAQVYAIVELEWTKLGNQAWVQLKGVPQLNWYSVPAAPKAVRASSPPSSSSIEVPTETQRAVPIGR